MSRLPIRFTKMHALGNDFMVVDAVNQQIDKQDFSAALLAERHTGIGFDQLLLIEPSTKANFFCRIFNADGSEAEQCGNGLRCVARFIHENGLSQSGKLTIETAAGIFPIDIEHYGHIRVEMGVPNVAEPLLPVDINSQPSSISVLSLGNPHAILKVTGLADIQTTALAPMITSQACFPRGANVGFMEIVTPHHIRLRTVERGAGETLACGSNACAAAVAGIKNGWLKPVVKVEYSLGSLEVDWQGEGKPVYLTGPADRVYSGVI
jgi:diaminopimelate epimerase